MPNALEALADDEAGFVLGAALLGLGASAASRLSPAESDRCGAALRRLADAPRGERATHLAALARRDREPSAWAERVASYVDASWIEAAFAAEPAWARVLAEGLPPAFARAAERACIAAGVPASDAPPVRLAPRVREALQRSLLERLWPGDDEDNEVGGVDVAPVDVLRRELEERGATVLGWSLRGAPPAVVASAMAQAGRGVADRVAAAAKGGEDTGMPRHAARAFVARVAASAGGSLGPRDRLIGLGALALAHGASSAVVTRIAHRLPRAIGRLIEEERAGDA